MSGRRYSDPEKTRGGFHSLYHRDCLTRPLVSGFSGLPCRRRSDSHPHRRGCDRPTFSAALRAAPSRL